MTIVTPKTNFIDLLEDLINYLLTKKEDNVATWLMLRCDTAQQELEDIPHD